MTTLMQDTAHEKRAMSSQVKAVGRELTRYGLVVVVGWIGLMKFTTYEAEGIRPFVANSPLMSWVYGVMSVRDFSAVLGVVEVAIALLIAARPFAPRAAALGSALAVGMFLTTLSFLGTTPGVWEPSLGGFPALSALRDSSSSRTWPCSGSRSGRSARRGTRASGPRHKPFTTKRSIIMGTEHFQNLIIGSGVAGKIIAWTLASQGQKTVVVERSVVGGSCPNVACLPSKNVIHSAKAVSLVHPREGLGVKYLLKQDLVRAALPATERHEWREVGDASKLEQYAQARVSQKAASS